MMFSYRCLLLCTFFIPLFLSSTYAKEGINTKPTYWQTNGYGYVIEVIDKAMTFYDVTDFTCVKNTAVTSEYANTAVSQWITVSNNGNAQLDWHALHPIELKPINELPAPCASGDMLDFEPIRNFDVFWSTYTEHFPYGDKQNWNWREKYPIWRSMVTSDTSEDELAHIMSLLINQLRDGHAGLVDIDDKDIGDIEPRLLAYEYRLRQAWKKDEDYRYFWPFIRDKFTKWKKLISENYAMENEVTVHYDNFHFAYLDNNISYLRIDGMIGFTEDGSYNSLLSAVDESMQMLIPLINQSRGLVIDLRENGGGTDLVSMRLLSYFFKNDTRIGAKSTVVKGKLSEEKSIWVFPSKTVSYDGPIVVLTSQATASAAEIMLIGLMTRDRTVIIGEPSNGSFSDILPKQLPNGWQLGLSHQVYFDVNGVVYEEIGIPVSDYAPFLLIEHLDSGRDIAIEKAISSLISQSS